MTDIGLLGALAAGVLALLSPCSALLLPSFFAYAFTSRSALMARTSVFYLGLLITLVPLGTGAALASQVFYGHRAVLITIAGWAIIAIGVFQVLGGSFALPFADRLQGWAGGRGSGRSGYLSTLVLGAVYGLAGFCSGPVLGAILTLAATRSNPVGGALLLVVYALGMALPLFILAALWDRFRLGERRWLRGRMLHLGLVTVHSTALVSGLLFIAIGALFLRFDGTAGIVGVLGLGDTTDLEVTAQNAVTSATAGFPIWGLSAAVALVAGGVALRRTLRHR
ncbi:thiol-disulfide oxidoreductase [Humibacillus sp. DSM 29435]|uniref:cytochrome c biogenesis CcdA family protein n=1 Tax=Humibacillus sp. DSM 29435 TaxID=1869167 RepID=UPI000871BD52|nr:cytochrome c biogenesis CcdA family protein [Humibacillus sp. DSM 29435]OFE15093.1 thiol-disulfide oxidoreductase [Humibacillus sp. DSM 29435]